MARANTGSTKAKRVLEESKKPVRGQAKQEQDSTPTPMPTQEDRTYIIDQPAFGVSATAQKTKEPVEISPEGPVDIHSYIFEIRPGVGHRWLCVAVRDDGEEMATSFETKPQAEKHAQELQEDLEKAKAKREQEAAEKAAQIIPIVTPGNQVISLEPTSPPTSEPAFSQPSSEELAESRAKEEAIPPGVPEPKFYADDLILTPKKASCGKLHVIPELREAVVSFLGNDELQSFGYSPRGNLVVVTTRSYRKAEFSYANGKATTLRR